MKMWQWVTAIIIVLIIAAGLVLFSQSSSVPHPSSQTSSTVPSLQEAPATTTEVSVPATSEGHALSLTGWLTVPSGEGPFPVVILGHGCNGVDPTVAGSAWNQMQQWASFLGQNGYATLILDSYTARGLTNICDAAPNGGIITLGGQHISLESFDELRGADFYAAADFLAKLPYIDPRAIGLLGDSNGGASVLNAAAESDTDTAASSAQLTQDGGRIAAVVALYPGCQENLIHSLFSAPILILMGTADDWTPPAPCEALANYPRASGGQVTLKLYQGATHVFDVNAPSRVAEGKYHLAYDPAATADSRQQILGFFSEYLK